MGDKVISEPEAKAPVTTPEPTAVETEVTPAPATATTTSTTAQTAPNEPVPARPVGGVEAYKKMKGEVLSGKVPAELAQAAPTEVPVETPPVETPAVETPVETPADPAVETPVETPPVEPASDKEPPNRIRIGRLPEKDRALLASATELAAAKGISIEDAWATITAKPAGTPATETPAPQLRSREDVQKDIAAANDELDAAAIAIDNMEQGGATRQRTAQKRIEALNAEIGQITAAETQAKEARANEERAQFQTAAEESKGKSVTYWPEAKDPNSALSKKTLELADAYENDPSLSHMVGEPDAPFYFTSMAAKQLGILPFHLRGKTAPPVTTGKASTPPTATKPAPVSQRAVGSPTPPAATPASGDARTTVETTPDPLGLDKIRNAADYHKLKSQLTGQRY